MNKGQDSPDISAVSKRMRTIAIEEAYATPRFMDGPGKGLKDQAAGLGYSKVIEQLCDLGDGRIAEMDAAGIDVQVLSLTSPGTEQLGVDESVTMAHEANDILAEAIRAHPGRFAGFAALPSSAPEQAASELERAVNELGFKGALINGHIRGRYLDDEFFWPILERAEMLGVPIYLHPTPPPQAVVSASYLGNYHPQVGALLATGAWGWHIETGIHVMRIILSGAFDRYPKLQLIVGHMGEALPFMMPRIEDTFDLGWPKGVKRLDRQIGAYLREKCELYVQWVQLFTELFGPDVPGRCRQDHFLGRPSIWFYGQSTQVLGRPPLMPGRQREDSPW